MEQFFGFLHRVLIFAEDIDFQEFVEVNFIHDFCRNVVVVSN